MKTAEATPVLDPKRFISSIRRHPDFLTELPKRKIEDVPLDERREHFQRAIASGALAISQKLESERGGYDLDANLYKLVSNLDSFYDSSQTIDALREKYGSYEIMPPDEKKVFNSKKDELIEFNDTLQEVINAGASRFNFAELLAFMTNMHIAGGGRDSARQFNAQAREAIIGMRNEMSFEQLLIFAGIAYERDRTRDRLGEDFNIHNVSIDLKASEHAVDVAREKARRFGRNPNTIIWSHINFDDYKGQLTLPYEANEAVYAKLKPDLDRALSS